MFNIEFERQNNCVYISKLMKTTFKDTGALDLEFNGRTTWTHAMFEILMRMSLKIAKKKKKRRKECKRKERNEKERLQFLKDERHAVTETAEVPLSLCTKNCLLQFADVSTKCKFIQALLNQISSVYNSC